MSARAITTLPEPHGVRSLGSSFVRKLHPFFARANREYFRGQLSEPFLFVGATAPRAFAGHSEIWRNPIAQTAQGVRRVIILQRRVLACGFFFASDVLLHEMIHMWQVECEGDTESGYRGHGPKFAGQCNAIGARLGLSPVGVKGRKGLPDCARWPVCVRAAGHYQNAAAERERQKRGAIAQKRTGL